MPEKKGFATTGTESYSLPGQDKEKVVLNIQEDEPKGVLLETKKGQTIISSGNLFIEFECRGKASGVAVSSANTFLYYFPYYGEYWAIQMTTLRRLIADNKFRTTQESGDDGSNTKGYLIPREKFKSYFKVYKTDYEWEK